MAVPTFVDIQGFFLNTGFIVKEAAILRKGYIVSHYIFECPVPLNMLTESEKRLASWVINNHHGLRWEDGNVPYSKARLLITTAITSGPHANEEAVSALSSFVYVKGHEKRDWAVEIFGDAEHNYNIENLDESYLGIPPLHKLDPTHTLRCDKHIDNCALQNVFKLFNWWSIHHDDSVDLPHLFFE